MDIPERDDKKDEVEAASPVISPALFNGGEKTLNESNLRQFSIKEEEKESS